MYRTCGRDGTEYQALHPMLAYSFPDYRRGSRFYFPAAKSAIRTPREPTAAAAAPAPVPDVHGPAFTSETGPGVPKHIGGGRQGRYPGDPTPPGTIVNG